MPKQWGKVRMIAGQWRGRKINVPAASRPTLDRIRETLFNWLMPVIEGATCLDLFAGSGALGFEALSRGAKFVTFVECDHSAVSTLKENAVVLNANNYEIIEANVPHLNAALPHAPYDIIFLDPPYQQNLISPTIHWLEQNNLIAHNGYIYVEVPRGFELNHLPDHWHCHRQQKTSRVEFCLLKNE